MKIWYDASAGKHIRYGAAIAKQFRKSGHEVIFTTREHPDTLALAKSIGETPLIVGKYGPSSASTRLKESAKRVLELSNLFKDNVPDVAINSQSVELCRVAFGLSIPTIMTADTPYAEAVNRLTIPLVNVLVASNAIPARIFRRYGARKIIQFNGVDEIAWMQGFKPSRKFETGKPLIVVRQMESKASYAHGKVDFSEKLAKKLGKLGKVFFLPRYEVRKVEGLLTSESFVDTVELVSNADLVVGVGGTIGREAALQGIPSIVVSARTRELRGRTYVNEFLSKEGFPLFITPVTDVLDTAKKHIGVKWNVRKKILQLENPVLLIERIVTKKEYEKL